ncbi:1942_t:CDS:2, partial [Racocetra fulgida]
EQRSKEEKQNGETERMKVHMRGGKERLSKENTLTAQGKSRKESNKISTEKEEVRGHRGKNKGRDKDPKHSKARKAIKNYHTGRNTQDHNPQIRRAELGKRVKRDAKCEVEVIRRIEKGSEKAKRIKRYKKLKQRKKKEDIKEGKTRLEQTTAIGRKTEGRIEEREKRHNRKRLRNRGEVERGREMGHR